MSIISNQWNAVKVFLQYFGLKNSVEKAIFWVAFVFIVGIQFRHFSFLINHTKILGYDSYLMEWMSLQLKTFYYFKHPLLNGFFLPFKGIIWLVSLVMSAKPAVIGVYIFLHLSVMYTLVFIYRILHELLQLTKTRSVILTLLFFSFAHIIMQAFVIDTYPFSLLLLTVTLYIIGREIYLKEVTNPYLYSILFILTAGVTITNGIKTVIALYLTPKKSVFMLKWMIPVGIVFLVLVAMVRVPMGHIAPPKKKVAYVQKNADGSVKVPGGITNPFLSKLLKATGREKTFLYYINFDVELSRSLRINWLGESILFHTSDFKNEIETGRDVYMEYKQRYYDWIIALFYSLVAFSVVISLRNKFVRVLLAFLFVDVFIHVICRFGIGEPYIYSAHWNFLLPIFLAFLYKSSWLKNFHYFFDVVFILLAAFFLYSNWQIVLEWLAQAS